MNNEYDLSWMERNCFKVFWLCAGLFLIGFFVYGYVSPDGMVNIEKQEKAKFESVKNDCKSLALFIRDHYSSDSEKAYEHYYSWSCQK